MGLATAEGRTRPTLRTAARAPEDGDAPVEPAGSDGVSRSPAPRSLQPGCRHPSTRDAADVACVRRVDQKFAVDTMDCSTSPSPGVRSPASSGAGGEPTGPYHRAHSCGSPRTRDRRRPVIAATAGSCVCPVAPELFPFRRSDVGHHERQRVTPVNAATRAGRRRRGARPRPPSRRPFPRPRRHVVVGYAGPSDCRCCLPPVRLLTEGVPGRRMARRACLGLGRLVSIDAWRQETSAARDVQIPTSEVDLLLTNANSIHPATPACRSCPHALRAVSFRPLRRPPLLPSISYP
jgi:hypothetical protein